jgi:hypothetical protein
MPVNVNERSLGQSRSRLSPRAVSIHGVRGSPAGEESRGTNR